MVQHPTHPPNPIVIAVLRKYGDGPLAPSAALPICRDLLARLLKNPRSRETWEALAYTALKASEGVGNG